MVTTAVELRDAVEAGARHIEIQDHLDLTELELAPGSRILGALQESIHSIRVRYNYMRAWQRERERETCTKSGASGLCAKGWKCRVVAWSPHACHTALL